MNTIAIYLKDATIQAYIGVYEEERAVAQTILVHIEGYIPTAIFVTEKLDTTVNYEIIWNIVQQCFLKKWQLLESAAEAIAHDIKHSFPHINNLSVSLSKPNSIIPHFNGRVGITYHVA